MSAAAELQAALVAALRARPGIAGVAPVLDGAGPGQALPWVAIGDGFCLDWSTKTEAGREHRVTIAIWDEPARAARLHGLVAAAEDAVAGLPRALPNHRIVGLWLLRSRILRPAGGPWAGMVEYRVRTVAA